MDLENTLCGADGISDFLENKKYRDRLSRGYALGYGGFVTINFCERSLRTNWGGSSNIRPSFF